MSTLNIPDRIDLNKFLGLLVCTTQFRLEVESLIQELIITPEEYSKYEVSIVDGKVRCNDDNYLKEISPIGHSVRNTIEFFIENGREQFSNDTLYAQAVESFKKII